MRSDPPPETSLSGTPLKSAAPPLVGETLELPPGVGRLDWELERSKWQNPRIRSLLGCIKVLERVHDSNFSILHCSPERLETIWKEIHRVAGLLRKELAYFLRQPSVIPDIEQARRKVETTLQLVERTVLAEIDRIPSPPPADRLPMVRKLLCTTLGQLHSFLQEGFGQIVAADPRSQHDADYFLSKRFPRDVEESEWLHESVAALQEYLQVVERLRFRDLTSAVAEMSRQQMLPGPAAWSRLTRLLDLLVEQLAPRLRSIVALRGIRIDEIEVLDHYAKDIPTRCRVVIELGSAARRTSDAIRQAAGESRAAREQAVRDVMICQAKACQTISSELTDVDRGLQDLWVFVPFWLENIERRRALMLRRGRA